MIDLIRMIARRFSGVKYPEYAEYRADTAAAPLTEEQIKYKRVQMLGGLIIIVSLPVSIYLYFIRDEAPKRTAPDDESRRAAARVLQDQFAADQEMNSLSEIKQWAATIERDARKEVATDSRYQYIDNLKNQPARRSDENRGDDMLEFLYRDIPGDSIRRSSPGSDPGANEAAAPGGSTAPSDPPATPREPSSNRDAALPAVYVPPSKPAAADSPVNPYRPRKYEPIVIEPKRIDPY